MTRYEVVQPTTGAVHSRHRTPEAAYRKIRLALLRSRSNAAFLDWQVYAVDATGRRPLTDQERAAIERDVPWMRP